MNLSLHKLCISIIIQLVSSQGRERESQQLRVGPVEHGDGQHRQVPGGEDDACGTAGSTGAGPEDSGGDPEPHAGCGEPTEGKRPGKNREGPGGQGGGAGQAAVSVHPHHSNVNRRRSRVPAIQNQRLQQTPQQSQPEGSLLSSVPVVSALTSSALRVDASVGEAQTSVSLLLSAENQPRLHQPGAFAFIFIAVCQTAPSAPRW